MRPRHSLPMPQPQLIAIILTYNSARSLPQVVESCRGLADRILVVDSFSGDGCAELACRLGCEAVQHAFDDYSRQRNWAQEYARPGPEDWFLHLDSDEVLSVELRDSIRAALARPAPDCDGFLMRRLSYFMGRPIRHGLTNPSWHLRLYRAMRGRCEDRLYDQHFIVPGRTERLNGL